MYKFKKSHLSLAIILFSPLFATLTNAQTTSRADVEIIQSFDSLTPGQYHRVCGNLLTGMAIAGQRQHLKQMKSEGTVSEKALATALAAILHITKDPKSTPARKAEAQALTLEVESLPAKDHIAIVVGCANEAADWVKKGELTPIQLKPAIEIAEQQLKQIGKGAKP